MKPTIRKRVLDAAADAVLQDRNVDYGSPEDNFSDIGEMYDIYRRGLPAVTRPHDVAVFLLIVKICRIKQSPTKLDHWIDGAGYSACGAECATRRKGVKAMACKGGKKKR